MIHHVALATESLWFNWGGQWHMHLSVITNHFLSKWNNPTTAPPTSVAPTWRRASGGGASTRSVTISHNSAATREKKIASPFAKFECSWLQKIYGCVWRARWGGGGRGEEGALSKMWLMKIYIFVFTSTLAESQNTAITAPSCVLKDTRFLVARKRLILFLVFFLLSSNQLVTAEAWRVSGDATLSSFYQITSSYVC